MANFNHNSFQTHDQLKIGKESFHFHSIKKLKKNIDRLPFSLKILLENLLRYEDGITVRPKDIEALMNWDPKAEPSVEIQFRPSRILLQDFTGVPAVADLAAMRGAIKRLGGDPNRINPLQRADLVIDHSVQVDHFGTPEAHQKNNQIEFQRNRERYEFLKWGQSSFKNFGVVPPDTGIVHQVNLEYLAKVAWTAKDPLGFPAGRWVYPDSLVGTDSHTTMINGLGILGWGVGGIEAEAAMLGQPIVMLIPQVVGFKISGKLKAGTNATDLVLTAVQMLRKKGVVNKFVEFFGPGLQHLSLADRATIANMAPEYGATCGIFPVDKKTIEYMQLTGRESDVEVIEGYYRAMGMWFDEHSPEAQYSDTLQLDLSTVEPSLAGPARPQDRVALSKASSEFKRILPEMLQKNTQGKKSENVSITDEKGRNYSLHHGSTVIAAITSCTNTSNPAVLIAAGLVAKKANEMGLKSKPWVKTSLAPGSKVVTEYLKALGLLSELEAQGFHIVGYGCTTCIGNSGPLPEPIVDAINKGDLVVTSVLSGNRNFEGRISPNVRANYLASPPLVVAYALAGDMNIDISSEPLGEGKNGKPVYLKDIWPSDQEIQKLIQSGLKSKMYKDTYAQVQGPKEWQALEYPKGDIYKWDADSTYIKEPPFFEGMKKEPEAIKDVQGAYCLALLKDSVTTDHISPAGSIKEDSPAGKYLKSHGIQKADFNSFGARRGNHEVMIRGTFANTRLKNQLVPGIEGGVTIHIPSGKQMSIYDASMQYQADQQALIIIAGKEYGTGSSRDWAAKGTLLLGVRAVIAQSFERIHRSNLVGMGVLPLQFLGSDSYESLGLDGTETFDMNGLAQLQPGQKLTVHCHSKAGKAKSFDVLVRIDTPNEIEYFRNGGILRYVLRQILKGA